MLTGNGSSKIEGIGQFTPYRLLHRVAKSYIDYPADDWEHNPLVSLVFTSFLLESYVHHLHSNLIQCWNESASRDLSAIQKIEHAHKALGLPFNKSKNKLIYDLVRQRNIIAHARTLTVSAEVEELRSADVDILRNNQIFLCPPDMDYREAWDLGEGYIQTTDHISQATYEKFYPTHDNAKKAFDAVCSIIRRLDGVALKQLNGSMPEFYEGPFEGSIYTISYRH